MHTGVRRKMNPLLESPQDSGDLSRWWLRTIGVVMVIGFGLLLTITFLAYRNAPPIPGKVVDAQGAIVFTGTVTGVHKLGTTADNTMYSIAEHDHHPGEAAVVFLSGKALTRTAK